MFVNIRLTIIIFEKDLFLPKQNNSSIEIIYIINCMKCNVFYIGESKRATKDRIREHLNNIKKLRLAKEKDIIDVLINENKWSEVAKHFNLSEHNLDDHFKFYVFDSNVINDECRFSIETDLINIFKELNLNILNDVNKQPSVYNTKYLTFLK